MIRGALLAWTAIAEKQPLLTLAVTNGTLGGVGDLLAQAIEHHNTKDGGQFRWNATRTLRFVAWGALCAPVFHKWYSFINTRIPLPPKGRLFALGLAKRVATDQLVFAPVGIAGFFVAMNFMEGRNWESARLRLREYYLPTMAANYAVWPAVQTVNFGWIPMLYRVPFCSVVSIFWNAFISWANAQSASAIDLPEETPHALIKPRHPEAILPTTKA
ncbi:hypothetical protein LPJ60_004425 [Coemansia sp. RSA 2675]|uniref:Uncharacterized protein n=1 Tax=Coemansia linderi TaxID=2663919 RepID=A0ACC1KNU9_9FUNG|nr:hypothetical protein LPJ60_004425 [Coemansia sp. RSA 2675]KAJ2701904.1 hypothetical protein H4218_001148 [Coemansia sp. IMI 209128]KAJ2792756.1 hypothetical protein GGI18_000127 [Coemansia linderi]